jgi:hypothetical protein
VGRRPSLSRLTRRGHETAILLAHLFIELYTTTQSKLLRQTRGSANRTQMADPEIIEELPPSHLGTKEQ